MTLFCCGQWWLFLIYTMNSHTLYVTLFIRCSVKTRKYLYVNGNSIVMKNKCKIRPRNKVKT